MTEPLILSEAGLATHFSSSSALLINMLAADGVELGQELTPRQLIAILLGRGCEYARRNLGPNTYVAPLTSLNSGIWAWLGYREEWDIEPPAGSAKRYSFRSASLTVHFGYKNVIDKPQMFRAEWAGYARWDSQDYRHAAGNAGHPHWQIDALESVRRPAEEERAASALAVLRMEGDGVRDFQPQAVSAVDVFDTVGAQKLSRLHFASAAKWWMKEPQDVHASAPATAGELRSWLGKTVQYILGELDRLKGA